MSDVQEGQSGGPVSRDEADEPSPTDPSHLPSRRRRVANRVLANRLALLGLVIVVALVLTAGFAPYIAPHDPTEQDYSALEQPPSAEHPFGTDTLGRDVFSRVVHGAKYAVFLGVVIVGIQMLLGVSLGLIAGYYGGLVEAVIMRTVDVALSIPGVVLALAIAGMLGGGLFPLVVAISLVGWRGFARLVRGDVKSVMEEEYVDAAKGAGVSDARLIVRHILPNVASSIIVYATLTIPTVILWAAGLSFLGMGVNPPTPEWGALIANGRGEIDDAWWISTFPGLAIMATVIGFNVLGDGLRDALDPRQSEL
jgi:peptide/nickel transport system permease protein